MNSVHLIYTSLHLLCVSCERWLDMLEQLAVLPRPSRARGLSFFVSRKDEPIQIDKRSSGKVSLYKDESH